MILIFCPYSSKARYRDITSFTPYRKPLSQCICFLLRLHARYQNADSQKRKTLMVSLSQCLGEVKLSAEMTNTVDSLYRYLLNDDDKKDSSQLYDLVHQLCVQLLQTKTSIGTAKVAYPMDHSMLLEHLHPNGTFKPAGLVTPYCAKLQFCYRSIGVHIIRMLVVGGGKIDHSVYTPVSLDKSTTEQIRIRNEVEKHLDDIPDGADWEDSYEDGDDEEDDGDDEDDNEDDEEEDGDDEGLDPDLDTEDDAINLNTDEVQSTERKAEAKSLGIEKKSRVPRGPVTDIFEEEAEKSEKEME